MSFKELACEDEAEIASAGPHTSFMGDDCSFLFQPVWAKLPI